MGAGRSRRKEETEEKEEEGGFSRVHDLRAKSSKHFYAISHPTSEHVFLSFSSSVAVARLIYPVQGAPFNV